MDKGGTRGKYAFFSILVAFLDATKRTSSAPIRFDRWLELFLPTARLHYATNVSDGSLLRKQSGRKENRSVRPSGNFRIAIIEAGVSSLMENYASGCLWERSFRNDSKVTRGYFLSDRSFRFFERANLWKLILRNRVRRGYSMRDFSDVSNLILSESISIFELVDIRIQRKFLITSYQF